MKILFVCTGNTCRSPMAKKILEKKAKERNIVMEVESAGIAAVQGLPASKHARIVIKEYGMNDDHTTKKVSVKLMDWADFILVMTTNHKRILIDQSPQFSTKIYTLKELSLKHRNKGEETEKLDRLYQQVDIKKQEFFEKNKTDIERLKKQYHSLKTDLNQIEDELQEYNRALKNLLRDELQEIEKIESDMPSLDVLDPFAGDIELYRDTAKEIEAAIDGLLESNAFHHTNSNE